MSVLHRKAVPFLLLAFVFCVQALQLELVHEHFGGGGGPVDALHPLSSLKDEPVKEYLRTVMQKYGDVGPLFLAGGGPEHHPPAVGTGAGAGSGPGPGSGPQSVLTSSPTSAPSKVYPKHTSHTVFCACVASCAPSQFQSFVRIFTNVCWVLSPARCSVGIRRVGASLERALALPPVPWGLLAPPAVELLVQGGAHRLQAVDPHLSLVPPRC